MKNRIHREPLFPCFPTLPVRSASLTAIFLPRTRRYPSIESSSRVSSSSSVSARKTCSSETPFLRGAPCHLAHGRFASLRGVESASIYIKVVSKFFPLARDTAASPRIVTDPRARDSFQIVSNDCGDHSLHSFFKFLFVCTLKVYTEKWKIRRPRHLGYYRHSVTH